MGNSCLKKEKLLCQEPLLPGITIGYEYSNKFTETYCCICFDVFVVDAQMQMLPCGHSQHMKCLKQWFKISSTCPMCRECYQK